MSKIFSLEVQNIKRIKTVNITPEGNCVVLSGKNGNGKSSTMDAIAMLLGGKSLVPSKPVREGEKEAKIRADIGDFIVTRHWTNPETSYLKLELKSGGKIQDAQTVLNGLVGNLSFDPLEFSTMEPAKQLKMLKDISGLDFTALDTEFKTKYSERALVRKEGELHKSTLDGFADISDEKPEMTLEQIREEREKIQAKNKTSGDASNELVRLRNQVKIWNTEADNITSKIDELNQRLEGIREAIEKTQDKYPHLENLANSPRADDSHLEEATKKALEYQANQKSLAQKQEIQKKYEASQAKWKVLNDRLKEIESEKEEAVKAAKMPIDGLGLGDGEILFNGIPFNQLSTSEQIRISMSVAMSLNPKLRVVMIKNGSLLDAEAMTELNAIAQEKDFQVWVEKVSDQPDGNSIFIENGEVKEQ